MKCRGCGHTKKVHQWTTKLDDKNVTKLGRCSKGGCSCTMFQMPSGSDAKRLAANRKRDAIKKKAGQVAPGRGDMKAKLKITDYALERLRELRNVTNKKELQVELPSDLLDEIEELLAAVKIRLDAWIEITLRAELRRWKGKP